MGAKRAIYFGPPDRPNRGFFYGPSYESIWTNDFHYKACCAHEKNYFQFDGEGDTVGRPQTLLMRSWRLELEKQAQEQRVAARISSTPAYKPPQTATRATPSPPPPPPYLLNCSPDLCPPSFQPAGSKRYTLSPDKPPPPPKEFARELWDATHTRIIYMKTAKPSVTKPPPARAAPTALPPITSPAVSPQKAQQQLREMQQQQQQQQQQQPRHATIGTAKGSGGSSVLLTRDGEARKDYVAEVAWPALLTRGRLGAI
jgi:hypothetical protein